MNKNNPTKFKSKRFGEYGGIYLTILLSSILCTISSFVLSVDSIILAKDPNTVLSCDINSFVSCGKVAGTWQADLLGFPNAFIGLMMEPIVVVLAILGLSGVKYKKWFMTGVQFVYSLAFIFALWLFYQSAFVIGAFCPWCLVITFGTTITFFSFLRLNILTNNIYGLSKLNDKLKFLVEIHVDVLIECIVLLILFIILIVKYLPFFM